MGRRKSVPAWRDEELVPPVSIAECVTTTLDRLPYNHFESRYPVTRRSTADNGRTIELTSGHPQGPAVIQWMAWIWEDSSVEIRSRFGTDDVLETFHE
jgi:hypothetical protein